MADQKHNVIITQPTKVDLPSFKEIEKDDTEYTFLESNTDLENTKVLGNKVVKMFSNFMPETTKLIKGKKTLGNWGLSIGQKTIDTLAKVDSGSIFALGIGMYNEFKDKKSKTWESREQSWGDISNSWKSINWQSALGDGENNVFMKTVEGINNHIKDLEKFAERFEKAIPEIDSFKITLPKKVSIKSDSINKENFAEKVQAAANAPEPGSLRFSDMISQFWGTNDSFQNLFDVFFVERENLNGHGTYLGDSPLTDWFRSAKILSARVESISLPSIQGTTTTHNFIGSSIEKRTNGMTDSHQGSFTIRGDDSLHLIRRLNQISQTNIADMTLSTELKKHIKGFEETFGDTVSIGQWRIAEGELPPTYFSQNNKTFEIHIYINRANELVKRGDAKDINGFVKGLHYAQTEIYMLRDTLRNIRAEFARQKTALEDELKKFNKDLQDGKLEEDTLNYLDFSNRDTLTKDEKNSLINNEADLPSAKEHSEKLENMKKSHEENIKKKKEDKINAECSILKAYSAKWSAWYEAAEKKEKEAKSYWQGKAAEWAWSRLTQSHIADSKRRDSKIRKSNKDFEAQIKAEKDKYNSEVQAENNAYDNAVTTAITNAKEMIADLEKKKEILIKQEAKKNEVAAIIDEICQAISKAYQPYHIEIKNVKILGTDNAISFKRDGASTQSFTYNFIYRDYEIKQGKSIINLSED